MSTAKQQTVLIVEDQEQLAEAYTTVISTEYGTKTATSGNEALEKVDESVGVVILDRRMPGMSGDEVLAALVDRGCTATVAMLTAVEADVDIIEMPFDDYVTKPIDNDELLALVETLFERREYDEQAQQIFRLGAKKRALEKADKQHKPEYDRLVSRIERLRERIDTVLEESDSSADPREPPE